MMGRSWSLLRSLGDFISSVKSTSVMVAHPQISSLGYLSALKTTRKTRHDVYIWRTWPLQPEIKEEGPAASISSTILIPNQYKTSIYSYDTP